MRIAVLDFLKSLPSDKREQYNKALQLFQNTSQNPNLVRSYNSRTYSDSNLEMLLYDLKKANAISDADIRNHILKVEDEAPQQTSNEIKFAEGVTIEDVNTTMSAFDKVIREMSDEQKEGFTMADRYAFLKDDDCPPLLKALATDAVNSFHSYRDGHEELFSKVANLTDPAMDDKEIYNIARNVLKDFRENREIHAELEHYAEKKEILGEHPIFADLKKERQQNELTPAELARKIKNIGPAISKLKGQLLTADRAKKKQINEAIAKKEEERKELQAKLDAFDKK